MPPNQKALRAAFPHTLPILAGYLFLGASFGFLLGSQQIPYWCAPVMSVLIFAGSMQFVAIPLLLAPFAPWYAFVLTLLVNARHLFYGLSLLEQYKNLGAYKPYLIFGLTDETFSVVCSAPCPEGVDRRRYLFFITLLNQLYWIAGTLAGIILQYFLSQLTSINTNGIEFVMTALFFVIFLNQWEEKSNRLSALAGVFAALFSLLIFGAEAFLPPAMGLILLFFLLVPQKGGAKP